MTRQKNDTQDGNESQVTFEAMLREQLQQAVRTALCSVLEEEVDAFIGAVRYERSEQRRDYRNGHSTRSLDTSVGHIEDLPVPRTRAGYQAIRRSCLSAIIGGALIWIKASERCLSVA